MREAHRQKESMRIFLFTCVICLPSLVKPYCVMNRGSTPNLETIFIGKCNYFIRVLHKTNCEMVNVSCEAMWQEFSRAILNRDPCQVTVSSFDKLFELAKHPIGSNRSLFWSGTKTLAHQISKRFGFFSLEDTLVGYIADELSFCSAQNQSWFSPTYCPDECVSRNNPFWTAASVNFAREAIGRAVVVLNATKLRGGAVSNRSTFWRYEVPNLVQGQLSELKVVLVAEPDQERFETCREPKTLQVLERLLSEKNITLTCDDDSVEAVDLRLLMCFENPSSLKCQAVKGAFNSAWLVTESTIGPILVLIFSVLLIFGL